MQAAAPRLPSRAPPCQRPPMRATGQRLHLTGGRGRLAALVAERFRASGHEVRLYSRTAADGWHDLRELENPATLGPGDSLLHLGWSTLPATSERDPGGERHRDFPLLQRLLDATSANAARASEPPHFVFFSTGGAVYGNAPGRPNREDDACQPIGHYGRAKLAAEEIVRAHAARNGLPCAILRISNPYGYPVDPARMQGIVPHALRCALSGDVLTLWGDGSARKDFLHYTDFLSGLELALARRLDGTFNLCAGESHTIREVLDLVQRETGRTIAEQRAEAPAWDVHDSRLSNDRFCAATGWRPLVTLTEGIRRAARSHGTGGAV